MPQTGVRKLGEACTLSDVAPPEPEPEAQSIQVVLTWVEGAIGPKLLAYLLGSDLDLLQLMISGDRQPPEKQADVISTFSELRENLPDELREAMATQLISAWLMQVGDDGKTVARSMHEHVSGVDAMPAGRDELENALVALAADGYPALLFPPDPTPVPMREEISIWFSSLMYRHPQARNFSDAALRDPVLKKVFAEENEQTGHMAMIYHNTGSGGTVQLSALPEIMLLNGWRRLRNGARSPKALADEALQELRLARDVLAGKRRTILARTAFACILLPANTRLQLREGLVRPVTDADRQLAPESLKGQLSGTDPAGRSTTINYDGDVILEYKYPYKVRAVQLSQADVSTPAPDDMRPPAALNRTATSLRFSLMLAVERDPRAQLVQTWRYFEIPLTQGFTMSWHDPRRGTGIMPTELTEAEVEAWGAWYERLNNAHLDKIELALTRILRAIAERLEPSDVLIDSVIAWESLFGSAEGEPTFRVTTCLATLLEQSLEARMDLRKRLSGIYALRSKVVHGNRNLKESEYPKCQEALTVAIDAVRALITQRPDILALPDGTARSTALLLSPSPAP
jgi:Apea-like HEPN